MIVFGTRPEAIKLAPVIQALKKEEGLLETIVVSTGQHKEQLNQVLNDFELELDINLEIMQEKQSLCYVFTKIIESLDDILDKEQPDLVLVHGDTQTTISAAMVSFYKRIPVGHIEAGLRTHQKYNPWPEEMNRILTDCIADLYFAPTMSNKENLLRMGVKEEQIYVTGQTQIDAIKIMHKKLYQNNVREPYENKRLEELPKNSKIILVTAHRRESHGDQMRQMFRAMQAIVHEFSEVILVYPVHRNPNVQVVAKEELGGRERIFLLDPLSYHDMVLILEKAYLVLSDSGGMQEECPVFHKPLILMRETTEREEGIQAGAVILAGTKMENIYAITKKLLTKREMYHRMTNAKNPFGDGEASRRIVAGILRYFGYQKEDVDEFGG